MSRRFEKTPLRFLAPLVIGIVAASLLGGHAARAAGGWVVDDEGRVGTLRLDQSTRADVVAFAGRPAAERRDSVRDALGYGCRRAPGTDVQRLAPKAAVFCRTVFFINETVHRFATFFTSDPRYRSNQGVRIGMQASVATRLLHRRLLGGCNAAVVLVGRRGTLEVQFDGPRGAPLIRYQVNSFALDSRRHGVAFGECF